MRKTSIVMGVALAAFAAGSAAAETRGVTPTEVVFGMHTDLSGGAATYGVSSSNGVKMRFDAQRQAVLGESLLLAAHTLGQRLKRTR